MSDELRVEQQHKELIDRQVEFLRQKLVDLTNRNRLTNFRHSEKSRTHLRIIDELPDEVLSILTSGKPMVFEALPQPEKTAADESTPEFRRALVAAEITDAEYLAKLEALDGQIDKVDAIERLERDLRDRVREALGMAQRAHPDSIPLKEYARRRDIDPDFELPEPVGGGNDSTRHLDNHLQTLLLQDAMDRKLSGIYDRYRLSLQELGVNTLYCCFGFLEWTAREDSSKRMLAPLLLQQVDLMRKKSGGRYEYTLRKSDLDTSINLALDYRLQHEFGLKLPNFTDQDAVDSYLQKITTMAQSDHPTWQVRRFVTVGHFSFAKLAMHHDLGHHTWNFGEHSVIRQLLLGSEVDGSISAHTIDIDEYEARHPLPITISDADSSQLTAIIEAVSGKNLAIKGPPGTGKSQTITNIIAAAMAVGKSILFVAEKNAALEVVKKRLDEAQLGDFCAELHSTKSNKKGFLKSLETRLDLQSQLDGAHHFADQLEDLKRTKAELNEHYEVLSLKPFEIGRSIFDVLWAVRRRGEVEDSMPRIRSLQIPGAATIDRHEYRRTSEILTEFEELDRSIRHEFGVPESHPWYGATGDDLSPFALEAAERWADDSLAKLTAVLDAMATWPHAVGPETVSVESLTILLEAIDSLPTTLETSVADTLARVSDSRDISDLTKLRDLVHRQAAIERRLAAIVAGSPIPDAELVAIEELGRRPNAARANLELVVVEAFSQERTRIEEELSVLRACKQIHSDLQAAVGIDEEPTFTNLHRLLEFAQLAAKWDRNTILARSDSLVTAQAALALDQAEERASELNKVANYLRENLRVPENFVQQDVNSLADAADTLSQTGVLGRVTKRYRTAKGQFRQASTASTSFDRAHASERLLALSDYGRSVIAFAESSTLTRDLGPCFTGIGSDFSTMRSVVSLATEVRTRYPGIDAAVRPLREMLLHGDSDTLLELAAYARRDQFTAVAEYIATPASHSDIDSAIADVTDTRDLLVELQAIASRVSLVETATVSDVLSTPVLVHELRAISNALDRLTSAFELLGICRTDAVDTESLDQVIGFWNLAHDPGLLPSTRDFLLSGSVSLELAAVHEAASTLRDSLTTLDRAIRNDSSNCQIDADQFFGGAWLGTSATGLKTRLERATADRDELRAWVQRNSLCQTIRDSAARDVFALVEQADPNGRPALPLAFEYVFFRTLANRAYEAHPRLSEYTGSRLDSLRARFVELDRAILSKSQSKLGADLCRRPVTQGIGVGRKSEFTELSLIQREIAKQRRHLPVRELVRRAGRALQQLKPCFMMSPLSIAQYLHPDHIEFDLVVIDEASQMRPEDSLSAAVRGRQLVVVGDPMQLPPTSFFDRQDDSDDDDFEDLPDNESILDLALGVFRPARDLKWHYRSRDDRLIAFSNRQFYDDKLIVFPRAHNGGGDGIATGVIVHDREFRGTYQNRINQDEARLVANAVRDFMVAHPGNSLGVVAMNQGQRALIAAEIESLALESRSMSKYLDHWDQTISPFFVKNLENVQGDERDAIFISTVYGPDPNGRVMQRFGPVNTALGHRRLNVLFTRAKYQTRLFTSMRSTDIPRADEMSPGVRALAGYLEYAFTGKLERGYPSDRESNDFEETVRDALRAKGYEIDTQVGAKGFFIDLALKHPAFPHGYLLGIECDGATYHSSKSARDRDRLRQEVLEGLGWTIYRIWSTDWFGNPREQLRRLTEYIEQLATERSQRSNVDEFVVRETEAFEAERPFQGSEPDTAPSELDEDSTSLPEDADLETTDADLPDVVRIGDRVEFEYEDRPGDVKSFQIGAASAPTTDNHVSVATPLARALLGAEEGDECSLDLDGDERYLRVVRIHKASAQTTHDTRATVELEVESPQPTTTTPPSTFRDEDETSRGANETVLSPYQSWSSDKQFRDPRNDSSNRVANGLMEIVGIEGPIVVDRLFRQYATGAGIHRVGKKVRHALNQALYALRQSRRLVDSDELGGSGQKHLIVRAPSQSSVRARTRGDRVLEEIPPSEIAVLIEAIQRSDPSIDKESLFRRILSHYGLSRLTNSAKKHLELALALASTSGVGGSLSG